jgi:periplasmic protein TonB
VFEDSLVESIGRIRTRSGRWVAGSLIFQTALVATMVLIPYLYPAALPRYFLSVPLIAPPPAPAALVAEASPATTSVREPVIMNLTLPTHIPHGPVHVVDTPPPGVVPGGTGPGIGNGVTGSPLLGGLAPPPTPRVSPAKPAGPFHVSSGVASGQLLVPIQPQYPAIAREARIQGAVVVAATISTEGRIESLRVMSGPPMLVNAAVDAIRQARYRPWTLNGQAVEVETTISVVFTLGNN